MSGDKKIRFVIKVVILYLSLGIFWILISDLIGIYIANQLGDFFYIEIIKGILFILTTGLILSIYLNKQAQKFIEFEQRYEILFRNHKSIMLIIDPDTGYIKDANKSAEIFYGYSINELKNLHIWDINILPEAEVREEMKKAGEEKRNLFYFKHKLKNGEIKDVQVYSSPVKIDNKIFLYSIINDVTDKMQSERELKNTLLKYDLACKNLENLIEFSPLPIIAVNKDGIVTIWNKTAEKIFGWKKEEVIGKFNPIVPKDKIGEFLSFIEYTAKGQTLKDIEIERINKDGKYLTLRAFLSPMYDSEGKISNFIGIFDDITEKKRVEKELLHMKKMESIGKLAAGISHDFNNMLTAIIGFASLLELKTRENEELNQYAKQILMVSERATNLTKALLTYSRKHPFYPRKLNLNDLIKSSIGFLEKIIGENIKINLILDENIKNILADPYHIEQIFLNLLTNAKDAMPDGGTIYIETSNSIIDEEFLRIHKYGKTGDYVRLSISDTGIGIPPEIKDKIFDPFFSTKEQGKGTGLGLSIVYGIVKQHNGYITLYSELNKGTTFNIYFPVLEDDIENYIKSDETVVTLNNKNLSILVVDDDTMVHNSIKSFLASFGCKIFTAENGVMALKIFEENFNHLNLVILDIVMPDMSGLAVYKEIKKMKPDIKFIFISGYNIRVMKEIENIPDDIPFIQKPFTSLALIDTINKIFTQ